MTTYAEFLARKAATLPLPHSAADIHPAHQDPRLLALAEAMWATPPLDALPHLDDSDETISAALGLGPGDGHDELTRCEHDDCAAWFWADEGADLVYETGAQLRVCAAHAQIDDPGARLYPGEGLERRWRDDESVARSHRIRTTGRDW